jgi:hypothetical protein
VGCTFNLSFRKIWNGFEGQEHIRGAVRTASVLAPLALEDPYPLGFTVPTICATV